MAPFELETWSGSTVIDHLDDLAEIYASVYAEPPYNSGPLWSVEAFIDRTRRQATRDGFCFIAACVEHEIAGFAFGLPFGEGAWWSGDATPPPAEILASSKFAVIELIVRPRWRRQGIGHSLIDRLLSGRTEQYAILTAMPNAPAREMYRRWGWTQTGTAHHTADSPILDALAVKIDDLVGRSRVPDSL